MPQELSSGARRVQDALERLGLDCQVRELPGSTRTAEEAARSIGCQKAQIAKSLVFMTRQTRRPILVVASGANRVDEKKLGGLVGEPVQKADADFVREHTGYAIGGVPPLAHAEPLETYLDQDLWRFQEIWAAAGHPHSVFRLAPEDLSRMTAGRVVEVK